jgi:hypothetical protein
MPSCVRLLGSLLAAKEGGNEECFCGRDLHWRGQGRRHNGRPNEMRFIKTEVHNSRWSANTDQQSYVGLYWRHCTLVEFVTCLTTFSVLQAMSVERSESDELQNIYRGLISRHYLAFDYISQWRTQEFFRGGIQQIQLMTEDRQNGDLGAVASLVRGSGGSCNLVQETTFHIIKFS